MARTNNQNQAVDNRTIGEKIATYLQLEAKKKELETQIKALKESIEAGMNGASEVRENGFVARIECGTQRKFDTTKFKAEHLDIYEAYRHDVATKSFKAYVEG